jgi:hypothetical protein
VNLSYIYHAVEYSPINLANIFGDLKIIEDKIANPDVFPEEKLRLTYKLAAY